jgi:hypothetical protein
MSEKETEFQKKIKNVEACKRNTEREFKREMHKNN